MKANLLRAFNGAIAFAAAFAAGPELAALVDGLTVSPEVQTFVATVAGLIGVFLKDDDGDGIPNAFDNDPDIGGPDA